MIPVQKYKLSINKQDFMDYGPDKLENLNFKRCIDYSTRLLDE